MSPSIPVSATGNRRTASAWAPLIAFAFVVAAALSCVVDQTVSLSVDQEPSAAAAAER